VHLAAIQTAVARLEPNVVVLDGASPTGYGQSWCAAAWLNERDRRTPVVMFTGDARDLAEAKLGESARSQRAAFAGIVAKPFDGDDHVLNAGDWVRGRPRVGQDQSDRVARALDQLGTLDVTVPIWDQTRREEGEQSHRERDDEHAGTMFHVSAFARVRLIKFHLGEVDTIDARFLGLTTCTAATPSPTPTVTATASVTATATRTSTTTQTPTVAPVSTATVSATTLIATPTQTLTPTPTDTPTPTQTATETPLERTAGWQRGNVPETYPVAV
jgi:hypothetical protein